MEQFEPKEEDVSLQHDGYFIAKSGGDRSGSIGPLQRASYSRLEEESQQIRLLLVHPGDGDSTPTCELVQVSLHDEPRYFALSYAWGDASVTSPIVLNGEEKAVAVNLAAALRNLRHESWIVPLWVDALCIDQKNVVEKGSQVLQMTKIYASAVCAWLWLGEEADDSDVGMETIRGLTAEYLADPSVRLDPVPWRAVAALLKRSWWSRVWVIQEALVSRGAVVRCGRKSMELRHFTRLYHLRQKAEESKKIEKRLEPLLALSPENPFIDVLHHHEQFSKKVTEGGAPLIQLILMARNCAVTDPRDKIYALLGLSTAEDRQAIQPDYTKELAQIIKQVTVQHILGSKELDILQSVQGPRINLPSWVQDLSAPSYHVPIAAGNAIPGDPCTDLSWPVTYKFSEDLDALTVPGVPFDIIDRAIQGPGREIEGDNEVYDRLLMGASPLFHEWEGWR
jgi:hypothetical protein